MSADNQLITRQDDAGVARLTLNQPRSINALSEAMLQALQSMLDDIAKDRSVRVVILSGAGDHFCAGHNLKEMTAAREQGDGGYDYFQALFATCSRMMQTIVELPQPVIAEVSGIATAAGCQLVATCDLAVADEGARFATPGVNIGLFCSTPMVALSRAVSRKQAMRMLLTGEMVSAARALEVGLISDVAASGTLDETVTALAAGIASKSPLTLAIGKEAFYRQVEMPVADAYDYASGVMVMNMQKRDAEEGVDAFIEKREPKWTGE